MRVMAALLLTAFCAATFAGCSKKVDWDSQSAVKYDKARDGNPVPKGGPGKGKKGAGGVVAP
jgi:hypothetical protein